MSEWRRDPRIGRGKIRQFDLLTPSCNNAPIVFIVVLTPQWPSSVAPPFRSVWQGTPRYVTSMPCSSNQRASPFSRAANASASVSGRSSSNQPAVVQRPGDEAEELLVADLDVAVSSTHLAMAGNSVLDLRLLGGRLDHPGPACLPQLPEVLVVGLLDLGESLLDGDLDPDPDLSQVREEFPPLLVPPQADELGPVGVPVQRSPHGVGQERGEVVDRGPAVDRQVGQERAVALARRPSPGSGSRSA